MTQIEEAITEVTFGGVAELLKAHADFCETARERPRNKQLNFEAYLARLSFVVSALHREFVISLHRLFKNRMTAIAPDLALDAHGEFKAPSVLVSGDCAHNQDLITFRGFETRARYYTEELRGVVETIASTESKEIGSMEHAYIRHFEEGIRQLTDDIHRARLQILELRW
ncbi:hypothetical protein BJ508DRAFT_15911 [Ascobolus immersus RN42]|uniref:Uncharacterized protein n=1 Tax=Ascobolus immersus RN42 TaxID=1160509 RepID=A0A3N4HPS8_ASCIM|nr:hypothetical protein BJ508DRAFT_15911 [Ascobolus immersus RN42]